LLRQGLQWPLHDERPRAICRKPGTTFLFS
jgi:hypothetical protein